MLNRMRGMSVNNAMMEDAVLSMQMFGGNDGVGVGSGRLVHGDVLPFVREPRRR